MLHRFLQWQRSGGHLPNETLEKCICALTKTFFGNNPFLGIEYDSSRHCSNK